MSCSVTSVFTFIIESTFDEWAAIFDSAEAYKRHSEFDIKPLFRGVSKENSQKVIEIDKEKIINIRKLEGADIKNKSAYYLDLNNTKAYESQDILVQDLLQNLKDTDLKTYKYKENIFKYVFSVENKYIKEKYKNQFYKLDNVDDKKIVTIKHF